MTQGEIVKKNLDLHAEFMRYSFEHPEVFDRIPEGAQLVILPDDDPALYEENIKVVRRLRKKGLPTVIAKMPTPKPVTPEIEVVTK